MTEYDDWNRRVADEFRANGGKVAQFEGRPLLLLHHTGAKTGTERVNPLVYLPVGEGFAVFGSKAGADTNPAWYHNLRAHPDTTIEVGTETLPVHARVAEGEERERLWRMMNGIWRYYDDYQSRTDREIPVVVLERL